jgi:Carboxypeptidase regulatory-like domain
MNATRSFPLLATLALVSPALAVYGAQVTGTVTDKTTGKAAAGDPVVMLDVQAGMNEVAHATTDGRGRYTLTGPGAGPYLIRVTHQGAGYFIAAPQGPGPGDIAVYDVRAKVEGVRIEADVFEAETDPGGQLKINERYFVHNTSSPPVTQWSPNSFEIVLPAGAVVSDTGAQRPNGLPTAVKLNPDRAKGHYSFDFPIQPDEGDKDTQFDISYTLPYSGGKYTFKPLLSLPADNLAVLLPKSMTFSPGAGAKFQTVNEDPNVQTFLLKNALPGQAVAFTVSGQGAIPREAQAQQADQGQTGSPASSPGGGIGEPINTPDPLSKYKGWILGGVSLVLVSAAAFLLRRPAPAVAGVPANEPSAAPAPAPILTGAHSGSARGPTLAGGNGALLNALKEELFLLESEKISGTLAANEYAEQKAALEIVLRRALKRQ